MKKINFQKGFTMVEMVILISVLIAVVFGGATVYKTVRRPAQSPTPTPTPTAMKERSTVNLSFKAQGGSNVSGTYRLVAVDTEDRTDSKVKVIITLNNYSAGVSMPAEIRAGTCANLRGVKYSLSSVVNGRSETVLNTSVAELKADLPLAIVVRESVQTPDVVICADVNVDGSLDVLSQGLR